MADIEADDADLPADHVIVGIDIGYTCTGVAISSLDRVTDSNQPMKPFIIQSWPGATVLNQITNKVPTSIMYTAGDRRVRYWGFAVPTLSQLQHMAIKRYFKFCLNQKTLDELNVLLEEQGQEIEEIENVKMWYTDYLKKLHEHIISHLQETQPQTLGDSRRRPVEWGRTKVEYHFSLPTEWRDNASLIEVFRSVIQDAGFGSMENTLINIELTEAVASAVYTVKTMGSEFRKDDLLIVCDAGGKTSDICILKVDNIDRETAKLSTIEQSCPDAGSVQIDEDFEAIYRARATLHQNSMKESSSAQLTGEHLEHIEAKRIGTLLQFETLKLDWGNPGIRLPGTVYSLSSPTLLGYDDMGVELSCEEIDTIFDKQIVKIKESLEKIFEYVEDLVGSGLKPPIILTGGLGSSAYVQSELRKHYNPRGIEIMAEEDPEEPPLSVCKGLVYDRMQRLIHGTSVITTRRCYASYGIVQHVPYQKTHNSLRAALRNPADHRNRAPGSIKWFIKYGDEIPEKFTFTIDQTHITNSDDPGTEWKDDIVISRQPVNSLPEYDNDKKCEVVCTISSTSEGSELPYKHYKIVGMIEQDHLSFATMVDELELGRNRTPRAPLGYTQD